MKKTLLLPVVLTMASTLLLADDSSMQDQDNDNTYTTRSAVMAITEKNVHGTKGGKNPPHIRSKGPFLTADFLYWRGDFDGLEIAAENKVNASSTSFKDSNVNFNGEWRPGVRAGIGWLFGEQDQWDLYANWTYFFDKAKVSEATGNFLQTNYIPTWSPILGPVSLFASGNWDLHFNAIDLEIGRNYFISRKIALRPHVGLRGAWIDLDYNADYRGVWSFFTPISSATQFVAENTSFKADSTFKGIGVRGGSDFLWHFTDHFGISSQLSGALLFGRFNISETFNGREPLVDATTGAASAPPLKVKYSKKMDRVRANIEAFLGLFFETGVANGKYHFAMHAGYELSEWFQQNELVTLGFSRDSRVLRTTSTIPTSITVAANNDVTLQSQQGDLGMQGLTVKFLFNF